MATPHSYLPPGSPRSLPSARKRHAKKRWEDPFLSLGDTTAPIASPSFSPTNGPNHQEEPLYWRLIATPFLFVSFLLSLFLVDTRNTTYRVSHATSSWPPTSILHLMDPEPYQDPDNTAWAHRPSSPSSPTSDVLSAAQRLGNVNTGKRRSWHLHKKIRKVARLEISDAFEMRRRVMVAMAAGILAVTYAAWCCFQWVLGKF